MPIASALVVSFEDALADSEQDVYPFPQDVWVQPHFWRAADWDVKLVALLLYHAFVARDDSSWASYVASLPPQSQLTTAADLDHDALRDTQYSPLVEAVECYQYRVNAEYGRMRAALPSEMRPLLTLGRFEWAMKVVHSRAFSIPPGGFAASSTRAGLRNCGNGRRSLEWPRKFALVPVLDMTNHGCGDNLANFRYDDSARCFELVAGQEGYETGAQVLVSYGDLTNDDLYLLYGFVQAGNPNDVYEVEDVVDWVAEHPSTREWNLYEAKLRLLERVGLSYEGRKFHLSRDQIDPDLVAVLRILLSDSEEFKKARAMAHVDQARDELSVSGIKREAPLGWFEPLTEANERAVWHRIDSRCTRMLAEFPTSIEFDEEMIILHAASSVPNDPVESKSLLFRVEKKRILKSAASIAREHFVKLEAAADLPNNSEFARPNTDLWADAE